jgi:predicted Zn-dependent peptidase
VTPADIQKAAKDLLVKQNRVVVITEPTGAGRGGRRGGQ